MEDIFGVGAGALWLGSIRLCKIVLEGVSGLQWLVGLVPDYRIEYAFLSNTDYLL